jgi:hypothetical protein
MKATNLLKRNRMILSGIWALAAAGLILVGCQAGPNGNPGVNGFSKGVITAKGSIFVNGVEFDTAGAAITVDGQSGAPDADLKVGMVVSVKGTIDSATGRGAAAEVQYAKNLEGTVDVGSIDSASGTFKVFGQTIQTNPTTVFEGVADLASLAAGDRVEVSGVADAIAQVLLASRVEKKAASSEDFDIKGTVSASTPGSFTLTSPSFTSDLTVSYTGTLAAGIVDGAYVEVKFSSFSFPTITTTADKVSLEDELRASDGERAEVSGVVSDLTAGAATTTFTVDGVNVSADNSLVVGLANGVPVEVKGTMSGAILVAAVVKVERESTVELEGNITASSVDVTAKTLTLNGVVLLIDSRTIFRDDSSTPITGFGLADLATTAHIEVSAYPDPSVSPAVAVATKVERKNPDTEVSIKSPVSAKTTNQLTMLGVTVDTSSASFLQPNDTLYADQAAFLAAIVLDSTVVKVKGSSSGASFTATEAQVDD